MQILDGEKILLVSDSEELILTTHRVRFETHSWGLASMVSFMLEEVSACEIRYRSYPVFLILAAASVIMGVSLYNSSGSAVWFIATIGLILSYYLTRRKVITIHTNRASINGNIVDMDDSMAKTFIDHLEKAKNDRYLLLTKS